MTTTVKQELKTTSNYDLFELHSFNREVTKTADLEKSMLKHGFIGAYPMHVIRNGKGKLKIVGGHHRYAVARKLGIPVKYVVCENDVPTIHELEKATRVWSLADYLNSYCQLGHEQYLTIKKYHERTGISLSQCISLCAGESAGSSNHKDKFKTGAYQCGDMQHAGDVALIVGDLRKMGIEYARKDKFVWAISKAARVELFDIAYFVKRAKANVGQFSVQPTVDKYLAMIEHVYNYLSKRSRVPVVFLATEEMRKRNAIHMANERKGGRFCRNSAHANA
jgi:hypothetical protein